jgi:phosphoenolpyruvate synthase/pyruvate phosphate dikinase
MEITRSFVDLGSNDVTIAGGKGASLGEMTQAGISVPEGYVILSTAFETFMQEANLDAEIYAILDTVKYEDIHAVEKASEKIQTLILSREMPQEISKEVASEFDKLNTIFVAVRSSATSEDSADAAWAGQLDTFLNTTKSTLLENVKQCWASLFTPRAIFYRFENKLHSEKISVAVVVQKMVNSEESGIAFSVHPITQDYNQLIIEAGLGLGEAVVSGSITPDSYVIDKQDFHLIEKNVNIQKKALYRKELGGNEWKYLGEEGNRQVLTEGEIVELSKLIVKIEKHYGFPCDIEWAKENGNFFITQSRPITTLNNQEAGSKKKIVSKFYSREHSLFYYQIESDDNRNGHPDFPEWPPIKTVVVIKKPNTFKTSIWHNNSEVDFASDSFEKALFADPILFKRVVKAFKESFDRLRPFVEKTRKIEKIQDLKEYYEALMGFWSPMSFAMFVPDMESPPKEMLEEALQLREETQDYADIFDELFLEYFERNFPQYKELSRYILPSELFILVDRGYNDEELRRFRERKDHGYVMVNGMLGKYDELDSLLEGEGLVLERIKPLSSRELKGSVACKGIVEGRIRIILDKKDLEIIKEGDILVTEMTSPDFVPALKKCSAIITDEGGIACHAAIVSRELNKPCIIGTKIATEFFKDGELVEVDADEGIVRILK